MIEIVLLLKKASVNLIISVEGQRDAFKEVAQGRIIVQLNRTNFLTSLKPHWLPRRLISKL